MDVSMNFYDTDEDFNRYLANEPFSPRTRKIIDEILDNGGYKTILMKGGLELESNNQVHKDEK